MKQVKTRFAVSPTGYLHVGGIRTALFDWLVARQNKGTFILRMDDTDQVREVEGAQAHVLDSLKKLGLDWDEGPDTSDDYTQSKRLEIYKEWAQKLVDKGLAYADPYTPEEVQAFRDQAKAAKKPFLFRDFRPENPPTWDGSQALRLKSTPKAYSWHDEVMGDLSAGEEAVDDFILIKSDGYPTYNFCNTIDDHLMEISHVIRAQEFLASMPKYLNLYEALDVPLPKFATVPPIMGPDGKKKLSKRDGAKDVLEYLKDGYLPEAMLNFLATLGWNDGTEQEVYTVDELIEKFQLDRVQRSGAKFDEQRLLWLNGAHIRKMSIDELYDRSKDFWPKDYQNSDEEYKKKVLGLLQDRLKFFKEIPELSQFFFEEPKVQDALDLLRDEKNKQLRKLEPEQVINFLQESFNELSESDFSVTDLEKRLNDMLVKLDTKPGILFSIVRIATTGAPASPALFDTLNLIGKDKSLQRIQAVLNAY